MWKILYVSWWNETIGKKFAFEITGGFPQSLLNLGYFDSNPLQLVIHQAFHCVYWNIQCFSVESQRQKFALYVHTNLNKLPFPLSLLCGQPPGFQVLQPL